MQKLIVKGGRTLAGEVAIFGAKNAALPILAASLLSEEKSVIGRAPRVLFLFNVVLFFTRLFVAMSGRVCRIIFTHGKVLPLIVICQHGQ